jgi:4-alpha-glucanotransferase
MKVLQFAFGADSTDPYLPHNYRRRCVVYTGTHDNDTTVGWWASATQHEHSHVQHYLGRDGSDIAWDFIRLALVSVAEMAIIPLQDVLSLGSAARMNTPGRASGNWSWRYTPPMLDPQVTERLRTLTALYGRMPQPDAEARG